MSSERLPRVSAWLVRLIVPERARAHVLGDLQDDYQRMRVTRGWRARWWLARECGSLALSYSLAHARMAAALAPLWSRDLRLMWRGLRRHPLAATGAALTLSVGLVAVFITAGLARTLLWRPISATHGNEVRRLTAVDRDGRVLHRFSFAELQRLRESAGSSAVINAVNLAPVVIRAAGTDRQTMAEVVDGDYFAMTGAWIRIGRGLSAIDDRSGAPPVVVLADLYWRRQFDSSPTVIGEVVHLNGTPFIVVGVAASLASSSFLGASVDAWVPMQHADPLLSRGWRTAVDQRIFTAFLWTTALPEVTAHLAGAAQSLAHLDREHWRERRVQIADATALTGSLRNAAAMLVAVLAALSLLILVAAASNLSAVLLARAAVNQRNAAIHLSIGSGRAAIVRRQMLEGGALGLIGAAIALPLYAGVRHALTEVAVLPTLALRLDLPLDGSVIFFIATTGTSAGVMLAIGPAFWAARLNLADAMRDGGARLAGGRRLSRTRRMLVTTQVCLSLTLIVGASLFMRSVSALTATDLGFPLDGLVAMDFDVEPTGPPTTELPVLARAALERVRMVPGVTAAAMSNRAPIDQSTPGIDVRARAGSSAIRDVTMYLATPGYFEAVGVPIVSGRAFREGDASANVVIVNQLLAAQLWPAANPLDQMLYVVDETEPLRVIGVARTSRYRSVSELPRPHLYRPTSPQISLSLLARTSGDPRATLRTLQQALDAVGPGLVGFFPRTMEDHLAIQLLPSRSAAAAASTLGLLALIFSGVGLYGLVAWFVELRRREIGVRIALGATAADVRRLVMGQALAIALPGLAFGTVLALTLAITARSALFGVSPFDPIALATGLGAICLVVMVATIVPGRRATNTDPAVTLRN